MGRILRWVAATLPELSEWTIIIEEIEHLRTAGALTSCHRGGQGGPIKP